MSTEREAAVASARQLLARSTGARAVAVVAEDPATRAMLVDRLLRSLPGAVVKLEPGHAPPSDHRGPLLVPHLGDWMQLTPGGLKPLEELSGLILDGSWPVVVSSSPEVWSYASQLSSLGGVVVATIAPRRLGVQELRDAVMGACDERLRGSLRGR